VVPPTVDLESPAIKQLIAAATAKAASEARLQALTEAKEAAEEAKRVAAMDAETRAKHEQELLKQEAATAKGAATKAENAVAAAAREAAIFRQLALTGLVPHDEELAAMIAAAAPATLVPGDTAWISKLAAARPYLFKATEQTPGTASPAEILAAGRTNAPPAPAAPAAPNAPRPNAHELTDEAWLKRKQEIGIR
jgi:colicin import membrane protein